MTPNPDRRNVLLLSLLATVPNWVLLAAANDAAGQSASGDPSMRTDPSHDFDFLFGSWNVQHRTRKRWLDNSNEWAEFDGTCTTQPMLGGGANVDDHVLNRPGGAYRAAALRAFDPNARTWSIWWLDERNPHTLGVPVVGRFENDGVGSFYSNDTLGDRPVKVRFHWSHITPASCQWEQAYSPDNGVSWELNWIMRFTRTT